jgi:hypothetical protein
MDRKLALAGYVAKARAEVNKWTEEKRNAYRYAVSSGASFAGRTSAEHDKTVVKDSDSNGIIRQTRV